MPHIPPQVKFPANNDKRLGQIGGADRASNMRGGGEDAREFIDPDHCGPRSVVSPARLRVST
jgi:hypothetical protein